MSGAKTFDLSGSEHSESTVLGWMANEGGNKLCICATDGDKVFAPYDASGLFSGLNETNVEPLQTNRTFFNRGN